MSEFIRNEACPKCRANGKDKSKNNLGVYSDSHCWCWSCGYLYNPLTTRIQGTRNILNQERKPHPGLPSDISIDYPQKSLDWIGSYQLTIEDLHQHNFLWSESYQRLIYPVWQDECVIFWTGRYIGGATSDNFGIDTSKPKWLNKGSPKDIVHCLNSNAKRIVIVEDIISGIKILKAGLDIGVLVLFNSHNPISKLISIGKDRHYFLWLDNDKFRESIFFKKDGHKYGLDIQLVRTDKDPKEQTINTIRKALESL